MKKKRLYHGFFKKYHNVYLYIAILVGTGVIMGFVLSNFIDVTDVKHLSSYLTTIQEGVNKYDYFVRQFFTGIVFVLFVFVLGTSIVGIPIISFIAFSKGLQIGFSCALFVYTYQLKGVVGILLTLLPQVAFDLLVTFLISASAIQLSMYLVYSTTNTECLDYKKLVNSVLNDIFICFLIIFIGAYLKSTVVIEFIKLFNLM